MESDLIGLKGGLNVYSYVDGSPTQWADFYGLCRIDVRFKPIPYGGSILGLYHAYIVTTDPSGSRSFFRGGPGGPRSISHPIWGSIRTTTGAYTYEAPDWDPGQPPQVTVLDNTEPCTCYNQSFSSTLSSINNALIGYIPLFRNSNSVAVTALTQAGFNPPTLPVVAPGFGINLARYFVPRSQNQ